MPPSYYRKGLGGSNLSWEFFFYFGVLKCIFYFGAFSDPSDPIGEKIISKKISKFFSLILVGLRLQLHQYATGHKPIGNLTARQNAAWVKDSMNIDVYAELHCLRK